MSSKAAPSPLVGGAYLLAGNLLLPLRLVLGWTYFSAFWRRLVLENKLDPDGAGYLGEKFNHFLPNALGIRPAIEFFVSHPELLWWKLLGFTVVEAVVGLAVMLGFMTRWMGLATALLAFGILLGAGWLGTTCLDEWQIGVLGVSAGLALVGTGGGRFSLDFWMEKRGMKIPGSRLADRLVAWALEKRGVVVVAAAVFLLTLATNQIFHGGVWGKLHNLSVKPRVELSEAHLDGGALGVTLYRVEGADVYGSFAIALRVLDATGVEVAAWDQQALAGLAPTAIENRYVAKVKPGAHSLMLPLGAKAEVRFESDGLKRLRAGSYRVELEDISGASWATTLEVP
ncbi:thiosulfate dehydrogenase [quinone] large subunit [Haloferula luteola]|uniref:Thiosulfate dehydrogenase [quinone] large subunit n=1 Tax=Haloferula luteola TaxID=595692 RepID=A0A840UZ07_9BACT|nr:TQO small subunit DoxD [Haloferula luteola]MBB5350975.1 thiosulfate dehydrogenase [quinone] large subunit [Haloferula luteola]